MIDSDEDARAALYREQAARRVQFQSHLWNALAGSPSVHARFTEQWQPLIDFLAERQLPEVESQDEIDPFGMSDQVNVGR
jgi:hypothetical protein